VLGAEGGRLKETDVWRGRIEDLSSIGSTKPESNSKNKEDGGKVSKIQCPVWASLSNKYVHSPLPYFMSDLLAALKGSRTIKSMLFHEYFIQNTKYLAVMNIKNIKKPPVSVLER
jgi:hypothetical protein